MFVYKCKSNLELGLFIKVKLFFFTFDLYRHTHRTFHKTSGTNQYNKGLALICCSGAKSMKILDRLRMWRIRTQHSSFWTSLPQWAGMSTNERNNGLWARLSLCFPLKTHRGQILKKKIKMENMILEGFVLDLLFCLSTSSLQPSHLFLVPSWDKTLKAISPPPHRCPPCQCWEGPPTGRQRG